MQNRARFSNSNKASYKPTQVAGKTTYVPANRVAARIEKGELRGAPGRSLIQLYREKRKARMAAARHRSNKDAAKQRRENRERA